MKFWYEREVLWAYTAQHRMERGNSKGAVCVIFRGRRRIGAIHSNDIIDVCNNASTPPPPYEYRERLA